MIDFKSLKLSVNNKYSFVGIEKKEGILCFSLPKGFSGNIDKLSRFGKNCDLFFLFYKIFGTFKKICADKGYLDKVDEFGREDRDGVIKSTRGSRIEDDGDDSENIFYSKLDIIGSLLDVYDEPKILSLAYRLGRSDKFDISQIHKYLHQALYLPNNAAYVDQMLLPKKVLQFESTDIVSMYCYLFCEVKLQLKENVSTEITSLSERFREKYLRSGDSLFDEQSYEQVLDILKDALEIIDHNTPIKDADYWQYYEAIELFLYGDLNKEEDGEIWGVSNFHSVWESMCLTYIAQNTDPSYLLYLDWEYVNPELSNKVKHHSKIIDLNNSFDLNGISLIPDIVLFVDKSSSYKLRANTGWNDLLYETAFVEEDSKNKEIKIVYINQNQSEHTINELNKLKNKKNDKNIIVIENRLLKQFYSWWEIPEVLSLDDLNKMYFLNHIFYLSFEKNIKTWDLFMEKVFKPLNIVFLSKMRSDDTNANVFTHSLLRSGSSTRMILFEDLEIQFNSFIKQVSPLYNNLFQFKIIDVKYESYSDLSDPNKIDYFKNKNIRKQFVYEYLLQKYLKKRKDKFSDLPIGSSFWLPSYRPNDPNLIEDGETFMDGYIQLKNINFAVLAENYIA
jgi:hypothetical protein